MDPLPDDWQRAVAVVAHPDDLEYGVASAVARWTAEGREVAYVLTTSGEAGIDALDPAECGPLREEEERRSAAVVGVSHVEFLGHPDGLVEYGLPLRRDLTAALRRIRPDVVITMNFDLTWGGRAPNHADHRATGLATFDACRDAANRWIWPELGDPCRDLRHLWIAAADPATHFVDVTATIDRGIASLREHRAYIDGLGTAFDPDAFLRGMAVSAGEACGVECAVTFQALSL
jgi:LmbE family N-acetylglucosaminyl deacetylase